MCESTEEVRINREETLEGRQVSQGWISQSMHREIHTMGASSIEDQAEALKNRMRCFTVRPGSFARRRGCVEALKPC